MSLSWKLNPIDLEQPMSVQTKVSIGLPVYNGERYLSQTITSILDQTFIDFELIVSDNASIDGTEEICRAFEAKDRRVHYLRQPRNIGASPNFNICYDLATGEYFKWAAHDDFLEPEYLAECVRALDANPDVVLCHTLVRLVDSQDRLVETFRPIEPAASSPCPSERFAARMRNPRCLDIWGVVRRAALRDSVLFGSYVGMDRALLLELALRGRFLLIDKPLFSNRDHPERATRVTRTQTRKDLAVVYDATNAGRTVLSTWILYKESTGIIRRNLKGSAERLRCFAYLLLSLVRTWDLAFLVIEPLMGLTPNVHPKAKSFKRSVWRAKHRIMRET
jgi:glycosyltransferase involved in cell wall biosynthesis